MNKRRLKSILPIVIGSVFLLTFPLFGTPWFLHILIVIFLNLVLIVGYRLLYITGLVSFCHITFYAIGAYTTAILLTKLGLPFGVCFLASGIMAAAFAVLVGWSAMRTRGAYFFIISLGFFVIFYAILMNWHVMTGGYAGIKDIPPIMGITTVPPYYYLAMVFCAATIFIMYRLDRSRYGRELYAIGDAEGLADVIGINVFRHRLLAFAIGAGFAGFAGSIHASYYSYIAPASFSLISTIIVIAWCVVGGARTLWGPIIATVALTLFAESLRLSGALNGILYAAVLFIFIMMAPHGISGLVDTLRERRRRREYLEVGTK